MLSNAEDREKLEKDKAKLLEPQSLVEIKLYARHLTKRFLNQLPGVFARIIAAKSLVRTCSHYLTESPDFLP